MKKGTTEKVMSTQDVLRTEIIVNQALIDILIAKQVITEEELVKSIQKIKRNQQKLQNGANKIVPLKRKK
ncbi:MAG: hypothetical protein AMJ61_15165 [Desulfobacterales bacterium SG8_35_2]|nr:MAG: hypothetical protein AMJ61_15165 [Desulfobacterales bacterium SG8_35_2]